MVPISQQEPDYDQVKVYKQNLHVEYIPLKDRQAKGKNNHNQWDNAEVFFDIQMSEYFVDKR
jgi:hypothetical protein